MKAQITSISNIAPNLCIYYVKVKNSDLKIAELIFVIHNNDIKLDNCYIVNDFHPLDKDAVYNSFVKYLKNENYETAFDKNGELIQEFTF